MRCEINLSLGGTDSRRASLEPPFELNQIMSPPDERKHIVLICIIPGRRVSERKRRRC